MAVPNLLEMALAMKDAEIENLTQSNRRLRKIVDLAIELQTKNYGDGTALHLAMIDWARDARAALKDSALGEDGGCVVMEHKRITLPSGRSVRKFIPYPGQVLDGTVRCFFCGQIDEPDYHDPEYCPATRSALGDAQARTEDGHG